MAGSIRPFVAGFEVTGDIIEILGGPISATTMLFYIGVVLALFVFPLYILLSPPPKNQSQMESSVATVSGPKLSLMRRPVGNHHILIIILIAIGLAPIVFFILTI